MKSESSRQGFTLIELSIVLVIIGLIVGGILVGQDLIKAAEVRSQISQIEKYNSAVNTFNSKFAAIPGDMAISVANQFGFTVGGSCAGAAGGRDGNGLVDGGTGANLVNQAVNETGLFWQDISSSVAGNLIEGQFPNSGATATGCVNLGGALVTTLGSSFIGTRMPAARIGHGNFVSVYDNNGYNWYSLSAITGVAVGGQITGVSGNLPVFQAYNMDKKVDDGLPVTGAVQAVYPTNGGMANSTNAATDSSTTCYNTSSNVYSVGSAANYGNGGNCAISFRFQ